MSKERIQFKIYGLRASISMEDWKGMKKRFDVRRTGVTFFTWQEKEPRYAILHECTLCRRYRHLHSRSSHTTIEQHCGRCSLSKFRKLLFLPKKEIKKRQFPGCIILISKILELPFDEPLKLKFVPEISAIFYEIEDKVIAEAQLEKIYDKMEEIEARRKQ